MAMNIVNTKIALNDETFEALEAAIRDVGSKGAVIRDALQEWLKDNGYLVGEEYETLR